jgi:RNA polymerase sigma-70 factor (ECF subfamily)
MPVQRAAAQDDTVESEQDQTEELSDRELVVAIKDGDRSAFDQLVLRYESRVYNHCMRMVNDAEESYDLAQEVFLKVYRNINNYQHNYTFYTWLYRITVNCCIDHIRSRQRKGQNTSLSQSFDDDGDSGREQEIPDTTFVPEFSAASGETSRIVQEAIASMSEKLRSIIVLKEVEGYSYEEIAEILKCSRGTVKSRLFRARERLKELLEPHLHTL